MRNFWEKKKKEILRNIEGLLGKLDDEDFLSTINYFDCITLVENWLKNDSTVNIQGFYSFSKFRQKHDRAWRNGRMGRGGGHGGARAPPKFYGRAKISAKFRQNIKISEKF